MACALERGLDLGQGRVEDVGDQVDLRGRDDIGRADVDVVAAPAVVGARHAGQDEHAPLQGPAYDPAGQVGLLTERLPAGPVGHELQSGEQPKPADVADDLVPGSELAEYRVQLLRPWPPPPRTARGPARSAAPAGRRTCTAGCRCR